MYIQIYTCIYINTYRYETARIWMNTCNVQTNLYILEAMPRSIAIVAVTTVIIATDIIVVTVTAIKVK